MSELLKIEGTVEKIMFRNAENGYVVLELYTEDAPVTVTGELGDVEEGEILTLTGKITEHPHYGEQFEAENCERKLPDTTENIRRYLASGVMKGIGKALANKIVDTFGTKTFDVMEHEPMRLMEVRGMTKAKCEEIAREAGHIFSLRSMIAYFEGYGVKSRYAMRVYRVLGDSARKKVEQNPYLLCGEEIGMSFQKADAFAHMLGIEDTAICRVSAGIQYILAHNQNTNGHTCLPLERLEKSTLEFLKINEKAFYDAYNAEIKEEHLIEYCKGERAFIYPENYYKAEKYIADKIALMREYPKAGETDFESLIEESSQEKNITYAEMQKMAIRSALSEGMLILTGGPGTGKTTTLNAIIDCFRKQNFSVMISAPTGRAAKRISDLTGYEAKTIHRLLECKMTPTGQATFSRNESNPLMCDVLIVDEMSMVDVMLFSNLLRALKTGCRMILVGDSDQLPSVGAGKLLAHLIQSGCMPVVTLTEIFRQAQQSCIVMNAHRIVNGYLPDITRKDSDFFFFHRTEYAQTMQLLLDLVCRRLPKAYHYSPTKDIQVIAPSRVGTVGVLELNKALQARLNPPTAGKAQVKSVEYTFREGDKVMQTRNNYDITWSKDDENGEGIFNGDIGEILAIHKKQDEIIIDFEGRIAVYTISMMEQLSLAYAITVHKSQGSEFEAVVMPLIGKYEKLSYRNLLYTAVTRAKKLLIIIGTPQKIQEMTENNRRINRYSCLLDMLRKSTGEIV